MKEAFSLVTTVVAGLFTGVYLDRYFGTTPLFTISLIFLGLIGSIFSVLKKK